MSGLNSTLSISKTAIQAQQAGLAVTGNNIANVNNPNYSRQDASHINTIHTKQGGLLYGTGVDVASIEQNVSSLLEERLTTETSIQASFEEQESYIRVLESFFDEGSDASITNVLSDFWNSWHDLANNPKGTAERIALYEYGNTLSSRFESAAVDMDNLITDMNYDVISTIREVNELSEKIADLNRDIMTTEATGNANDLRDQRNSLVDDLGKLIDINVLEQSNKSYTITTASSYPLVSGTRTNELAMQEGNVMWTKTSGTEVAITDEISGGKLGGILEMRDSVVPKFQADLSELSREMIWAINYQHSQGAGLTYFSDSITGNYSVDESGWLTSFEFGDKIDFSKDFTMWVEDKTDTTTQYNKIEMDMGISEAEITNWQGTAPGGTQSIYQLTVVDGGELGDKEVMESDGDGLATVLAGNATSGVATTLDQGIATQTLTVYNGVDGTQVINVADVGGDAKRSAASIAQALNEIEGVTAHASENSATLMLEDWTGADLFPDTHDGDEIQYSLYVDGVIQEQSFIRDSSEGTLQEQFESSLLAAAEAVNSINGDDDLYTSGLTLTSTAGRTIGIQDFEVQDNAGIQLDTFANFDTGDSVTFDVDSMNGTSAASTTAVTVDLSDVDTTDEAAVAQAFTSALTTALDGRPFSVTFDANTNSVILRTTDGNGIRMGNGANDTGDDATVDITVLGGTSTTAAAGDTELRFNNLADASDSARYAANSVSTDEIWFENNGIAAAVAETTAGAGNKNAVVTGTVTTIVEAGMTLHSDVSGAGTGGLFSTDFAEKGSSILTFGGEGGFSGFTSAGGETISFDLDGHTISFETTAAGGTSDLQLAALLETEITNDLTGAGVAADYRVIRTGSSVSVIKAADLDDPIAVTNFSDDTGNNARISVRTGTGSGTNQPENEALEASTTLTNRDNTTSTLYGDDAVILWERLDADGVRTGSSGLVTVEDEGQVSIVENGATTVSFDISEGSLVAGNILSVNTDTSGSPDPIDFRITGQANSENSLYQFTVESGGKVGHLPDEGEEDLVINWSNGIESGTFTIEGHDPPYTPESPVDVRVDGMTLKFYDGTFFDGDVFTVTTGDTGVPLSTNSAGHPTGETQSNWHWTLDAFTDQFNRQGNGMTANVTTNNELKFTASANYHTIRNEEYSEKNGFSSDNISITITDWSSMDFTAADLRFERSASGKWGILNDPTGGNMQFIPDGGDDDGFGIDVNGDGQADFKIDFTVAVSGVGYVEFDLTQRDQTQIGFAFGDDAASDSGLTAAAGINTFFEGRDATSMAVNDLLRDPTYLAATTINSSTGEIGQGDNSNALAMADVQYQEQSMRIWTYDRSSDARASTSDMTLDNYFNSFISSMGIESRSIKDASAFADIMVESITEQRNSVSAVSLDEEMIQLMQYQHAFSAASKLLSTVDEMLNTLLSIR